MTRRGGKTNAASANNTHKESGSCCGTCIVDRHAVITAFGWLFDAFTVAISVTDVVSDLLVARQFLEEGHTLWAWLVFGGFINASLVYSVLLVFIMFDEYSSEFHGPSGTHILPKSLLKMPKVLKFLLVLPFSQLAPTGMYFLQMFILPYLRTKHGQSVATERTALNDDLLQRNKKKNGTDTTHADPENQWGGKECQNFARVHEEESKDVQNTFTVVGRLKDAIQRQIITHGMLFAETIVESIPQSIIQLLAITFLGQPSTLQVVSMALSILSVVSKAYFLSLSFNVRVFIFKFSLLSFDVMAMFYIFATVLSQDRRQQVGLFGSSLMVSYMSYAWFIKLVAMTGATVVIGGLGVLILIIADRIQRGVCCEDACGIRWKDIKACIGVFFAAVLAVIPIVLVQESAKLSWVLFFMIRWEPTVTLMPTASILYAFLRRAGGDATERYERLVHTIRHMVPAAMEGSCYNGMCDRFMLLTAFLFEHLDFIATFATECKQKHVNARVAYDAATSRHPNTTGSSFNFSGRLRRAYTNVSKKFDAEAHPFGYINLDPKVWHLTDVDAYVESKLSETGMEMLPESIKYQTAGAKRDFVERCVCTLRDGEGYKIIQEYLAACRRIQRENAFEFGEQPEEGEEAGGGVLAAPTTDDSSKEATSIPVSPAGGVDILVMEGASYEQRLSMWKFHRIFNPERLQFFWNTVSCPEPPIDFEQPSAYNMELQYNPLAVLFWIWFPINAVCNCGFSIAFMFASFAYDYAAQNLLQVFCFYSSVAFLFLALLMLPEVLQYWALQKPISTICTMLAYNSDEKNISAVQGAVVSYYTVSPKVVVADAIPASMMPEELGMIIADYLGPDFDATQLTVKECLAMKRRHRAAL